MSGSRKFPVYSQSRLCSSEWMRGLQQSLQALNAMMQLQITLFTLVHTVHAILGRAGAYDGCTANVVSDLGLGRDCPKPLSALLLELQVLANAEKMISINLGDSYSATRSNKFDRLFFVIASTALLVSGMAYLCRRKDVDDQED